MWPVIGAIIVFAKMKISEMYLYLRGNFIYIQQYLGISNTDIFIKALKVSLLKNEKVS